jgi:hypothetical protein
MAPICASNSTNTPASSATPTSRGNRPQRQAWGCALLVAALPSYLRLTGG